MAGDTDTKHTGGRPTIYSKELALKICARIAEGESVRSISLDDDMPNASTIHSWVLDNEVFSKQYEQAKSIGAEVESDEMDEIARNEEIDVNRGKLIIDTKKWNLSKKLPKRFGDKLDLDPNNKGLQPLLVQIIGKDEKHNDADSR